MSLSDKLLKATQMAKVSLCKVGILLSTDALNPKDREQLATILAVPMENPKRVPNSILAKVLREEGHDISNSAVDRHRRGDCSCTRKVM
jgi:hypothetical protein